jgi:hypothetical protein
MEDHRAGRSAKVPGNGAPPGPRRTKRSKARVKLDRTTLPGSSQNPLKTAEGTVDQLVASRRSAEVQVDQPVALISQAPRSGGTLLRNLFDGHPQCHVHPYEWHFGPTRRFEWPKLRLDASPEFWWTRLREEELARRFVSGVRRNPTKYSGKDKPPRGEIYPLLLPPLVHKHLFIASINELKDVLGDRDIINAYMTGLFNGWLNNHALDNGDKRWVVAFAPRLAWGESREAFFAAYPDGHLIAVLRSPPSWMASAMGRQIKGSENNERLIAMWNRSAEEMIAAKQERPKAVSIVRFDDLVHNVEGAMRRIARRLKIKYTKGLTEPTFNTRPIGANSSYLVQGEGVITAPVERYKEVLSAGDQKLIDRECGSLYEDALDLAEPPAARKRTAAAVK